MRVGEPLEQVEGHIHLGDKPGRYIVLVNDGATMHDMEGIREVLIDMGIEALILSKRMVSEIHRVRAIDLKDLKEAIERMQEGLPAQNREGLTPERVVAALRMRPDLFEGVRRLMRD